jgi:hypothetical protein
MSSLERRVAENLEQVQERIAAAAARAGRSADEVRLVAVTKQAPLAAVEALLAAGCRDLAESRPQALWERAAAVAGTPVRWHLVGHLQRNKLPRTLELAWLIHSVDSLRLLEAIEQQGARSGRRARVLLEVNVAGEAAKQGWPPEALAQVWPRLAQWEHVEVCGLMGMAPLAGGLAAARRAFAALRGLRERWAGDVPATVRLEELSMGMSGDLEVAVAEGATLVRVGSALFAGVEP